MGNVYVLAVVLSVSWHTILLGTKMGFIQHGTSTEGKERWSTWQGNGDFAPDHNKRHCDITHQSHSEDQCVEIKDFFNPAMVSSGLHKYQFLLLVHLQCYPFWCHPLQFIAHSCTFFSQLICLSVPLTSLSSLLFFVTTTYSLSLWLCMHVFEHYWVPLLLKCTKCTTSWKRAFVPRQKAK